MLSRTKWIGAIIIVTIAVTAVLNVGILTAAILVGAVVFAAGVGLMHLLGDPVYHVDCPTRAYRRCQTVHNWATVAYFAGTFAGVIAASVYPQYRLLRRGAETAAADVRSGHVTVSGTVARADRTLTTPFTGEETVCYRYAVQERHNDRLFSDDGSWHTVSVDEAAVPFYVEDETGRVLVDPDNASLTLNEVTSGHTYQVDAELTVAAGETPPRRIEEWEREHGGLLPVFDRDKRYTEDQLRPGDDVTVVGKAESFHLGYSERIVVGGEDAPVTVSAGKRDHVAAQLTGAVWVGGAIGVLLLPIGLTAMLLTL